MYVRKKDDVVDVIETPTGERIAELVGKRRNIGDAKNHSLVYVTIPPGKSVTPHYHRVAEETYYILKGSGRIVIEDEERTLAAGEACLIKPGQVHHFYNESDQTLEFLCFTAPAWVEEDMIFTA